MSDSVVTSEDSSSKNHNVFHKVFVNVNGVTKSVFVPASPEEEPPPEQIPTTPIPPPTSAIVIKTSSAPSKLPFIIIPTKRPPYSSIAVVPPLNLNRQPSQPQGSRLLFQAQCSPGSVLPPRTVPRILVQNRSLLEEPMFESKPVSQKRLIPARRVLIVDKSSATLKPRFAAGSRQFIRPIFTMSTSAAGIPKFHMSSSLSGHQTTVSAFRPTFSIRPLMICPDESTITNPRTLTEDEAVAVGWHDAIATSTTGSIASNRSRSPENAGNPNVVGGNQSISGELRTVSEGADLISASDEICTLASGINCITDGYDFKEWVDDESGVQQVVNSSTSRNPLMMLKSESRPGSGFSDETMCASESETLIRAEEDEARLQKLSALTGHSVVGASRRKQDLRQSVRPLNKPLSDCFNYTTDVGIPKSRKRCRRGRAVAKVNKTLRLVPTAATRKVQKARRTGGRPMSASERFQLIQCVVWVERIVLPPGKESINRHAVRLYSCCDVNYSSSSSSLALTRRSANLHNLLSRALAKSSGNVSANKSSTVLRNIFMSTFKAASSLPAPATESLSRKPPGMTPISAEGTPILLHRVDGNNRKTSAVVMARPANGNSQLKKRFLLIRTNNGSFLVPADDGGTGRTASTVAELLKSHRERRLNCLNSGNDVVKAIDRDTDTWHSTAVKQEVCDSESVRSKCAADEWESGGYRNAAEDSKSGGTVLGNLYPSGSTTISRKAIVARRKKKGKMARGVKKQPRFVPAVGSSKEIGRISLPPDAHRERIEELKERLRLQQEQLDKIKQRKNSLQCSASAAE